MNLGSVLVTGASGFVGRAVCRQLVASGWHVVAAVRQPGAEPPGCEARLIEGLGPGTSWAKALTGIGAVVHLAARVHVMRERDADPEAAFRRVNAEGTLRLAEEAAGLGIGRFVFMSSVKVNGEGGIFSPDDAPRPADAYGRSKWLAESGLAGIAHGGAMKVTVLRPPLVYGPGVGGNFLSLLKAVARGWPLPLGAIDNRRSLLFVDNLADAVRACLAAPAPAAIETFLLKDGEDVSTPELVRRLAAALGRPARLVAVPVGLLRLAAAALGRGAAVERLAGSLVVEDGAIRARLGWRPPVSLADGLAATAAWYAGRRGER